MPDSPLRDVSDTAFWIAHLRGLESARRAALFHDPFAARLAGERGRKISDAMPTSRVVGWTVALRTRIIDDYTKLAINSGVDTVLSLGAGLDARPYRLKLPPSLTWIEADYAHILDHKETQLGDAKPSCRLERVRLDLSKRDERRELFGNVAARARAILILTEGVVPYLSNAEAASLADDLCAMSQARFWIVDYFSAQAMKYRQRTPVSRAMHNAPFKFEPADWETFFRQHGWKTQELRYFIDEASKYRRPFPLKRMRLLTTLARLWLPREKFIEMRRFAGYALLDRLSTSSP